MDTENWKKTNKHYLEKFLKTNGDTDHVCTLEDSITEQLILCK